MLLTCWTKVWLDSLDVSGRTAPYRVSVSVNERAGGGHIQMHYSIVIRRATMVMVIARWIVCVPVWKMLIKFIITSIC